MKIEPRYEPLALTRISVEGAKIVDEVGIAFTKLDKSLKKLFLHGGREVSACLTHLEIAATFALKAVAIQNPKVDRKFADDEETETEGDIG